MVPTTTAGLTRKTQSRQPEAAGSPFLLIVYYRNARELVDEFWRKNPQKKKVAVAGRKSVDKKSPKKPRKSTATDDTSDAGEISTKKRGRKSSSHKVGSGDEMDVDEEKPAKKAKKDSAQPSKTNAKKVNTTSPEEDEVHLGTMKKYMSMASWEGLIKTIDTVERSDDDELKIFFTLYVKFFEYTSWTAYHSSYLATMEKESWKLQRYANNASPRR